jgi:hypothetical protein
MSSIIDNLQISNTLGASAQMPRELIMDVAPTSMDISRKIVSVLPITSNSIGPSQNVSFLLPQRGLMRSGSCYLRFKLDITSSGTHEFSFAGGVNSCASLINQLTLSSAGVVLEQISRYDLYANNVINSHCLSNEALTSTAICEGGLAPNSWSQYGGFNSVNSTGASLLASSGDKQFASNFDTNLEFSLALYAGALVNKHNVALPLFAMPQLKIDIQTNPITSAFYSTNTASPQNYTMYDFELIYEEMNVPESYISSVRSGLNSGKLIKIEATSVNTLQVQAQATVSQQYALNYSSLEAILWGWMATEALDTSKCYQAHTNNTVWDNSTRSQIRYEVYADNALIFNSPNQLNYVSVQFRNLRLALNGVIAPENSNSVCKGIGKLSGGSYNGSYINTFYLLGLSMRKFISDDTSFQGSKVSQIQIMFKNPEFTTASGNYFLHFLYDYAIVVDGSLSVSKVY